MYRYNARVRYSETDATGHLSMQGLLSLFQDVSYLRAEDRGRGVDYQKKLGCAWFLLSWNIELTTPPCLSTPYTVESYFYRARHSLCSERLTVMAQDAPTGTEPFAVGDILWGYVDTVTRRPTAPAPDYWLTDDYGEAPQRIQGSRKIAVPDGGVQLPPLVLPDRVTDTNRHANNVRFTEWAMTVAGCDNGIRKLRAEFLRQTFAGTTLYPYLVRGEKTVLSVADEAGVPFAVFEFC